MEERKRQIIAWRMDGDRPPADAAELTDIERRINEIRNSDIKTG